MRRKEGYLVAILYLALMILVCQGTHVNAGNPITGLATSQTVDFNVSVYVSGPPSITLHAPRNVTYTTLSDLLLNYTVSGNLAVWFNIDQGTNRSLTDTITYFNISTEGSHTLFIMANNSDGTTTTKNITFSLNTTQFQIVPSSFSGEHKGNSTDFTRYGIEDYQNLTNIVLEDTRYGKLIFPEAINLTQDAINGTLNLSEYITIASNHIEIDTSELPSFNKSATLSLNGLTFTNPRILIDGAVCSASVCTQQEYSNNLLVFNVTHFTAYSAEETPGSSGSSEGASGSGGGGGGGGATTRSNIRIEEEQFSVKIRQGELTTKEIRLTNIGSERVTVQLTPERIDRFIKLGTDRFDIEPGETYTAIMNVLAPEDTKPDAYIGKIYVDALGVRKEILVAIEILSKNALMDVKVDIPEKFVITKAGTSMLVAISLYNLGQTREINAILDYELRNAEGETVYQFSENTIINTQNSFLKEIDLPEDLKPGQYLIYVRASYEGEIASASDWFTITDSFIIGDVAKIGLVLVLLVALIFIGISIRFFKAHQASYKVLRTRLK